MVESFVFFSRGASGTPGALFRLEKKLSKMFGEIKVSPHLWVMKQTNMTHEIILSNLSVANKFVTMQGFEVIEETVLNPECRYISYNERGQMCMARCYPNYQEVGNKVIEVKIID